MIFNRRISPGILVTITILYILGINIINILYEPNTVSLVTIQFIFYLLIAILIWSEKENLANSHIDRLSLFFFVFFGSIIRVDIGESPTPIIYDGLFMLVAILLLISLRGYYKLIPKIRRDVIEWILIGMLGSVLLSALAIFGTSGLIITDVDLAETEPIVLFIAMIGALIGGFTFAAIIEEPFYRGFLWGYLAKRGWADYCIWIGQAGVFWIAHLYLYDRPFSFWVAVPIMGLYLGFLAWKSKSIAPSMVAHAIYNGISIFFTYLSI